MTVATPVIDGSDARTPVPSALIGRDEVEEREFWGPVLLCMRLKAWVSWAASPRPTTDGSGVTVGGAIAAGAAGDPTTESGPERGRANDRTSD
jgi:hypothetical protein